MHYCPHAKAQRVFAFDISIIILQEQEQKKRAIKTVALSVYVELIIFIWMQFLSYLVWLWYLKGFPSK